MLRCAQVQVIIVLLQFFLQQKLQLVDPDEALKDLGIKEHNLRFTSTLYVDEPGPADKLTEKIYDLFKT